MLWASNYPNIELYAIIVHVQHCIFDLFLLNVNGMLEYDLSFMF